MSQSNNIKSNPDKQEKIIRLLMRYGTNSIPHNHYSDIAGKCYQILMMLDRFDVFINYTWVSSALPPFKQMEQLNSTKIRAQEQAKRVGYNPRYDLSVSCDQVIEILRCMFYLLDQTGEHSDFDAVCTRSVKDLLETIGSLQDNHEEHLEQIDLLEL